MEIALHVIIKVAHASPFVSTNCSRSYEVCAVNSTLPAYILCSVLHFGKSQAAIRKKISRAAEPKEKGLSGKIGWFANVKGFISTFHYAPSNQATTIEHQIFADLCKRDFTAYKKLYSDSNQLQQCIKYFASRLQRPAEEVQTDRIRNAVVEKIIAKYGLDANAVSVTEHILSNRS